MKFGSRVFFTAVGFAFVFSLAARANETSTLKCNPAKDQVWVYDSLATLDVEAKMTCGETVEIVAREKDYVKIRTHNGVEGYVPESAFSNLPAFESRGGAAPSVVAQNSVAPTVVAPSIAAVAKKVQELEIAETTARESQFANSSAHKIVTPAVNKPIATGTGLPSTATADMAMRPAPVSTSPAPRPAAPAMALAHVSDSSASSPRTSAVSTPPSISVSESTDVAKSTVAPAAVVSATVNTVAAVDTNPDRSSTLAPADPECRSFFSAYGLTPGQLKWIARNRQKLFPSVCPSPDLALVNYVLIFTHDVGFFSATMPEAVHSVNGFSDFRPLSTEDNALVSASDGDKARREYVWIFRFAPGSFDPSSFSPNTRFDFSKVETSGLGSKAGSKTVEDAFHYLESAR